MDSIDGNLLSIITNFLPRNEENAHTKLTQNK